MLLAYQIQVVGEDNVQLRCFQLDIRKGGVWTGTPFPLRPKNVLKEAPSGVSLAGVDRKLLMTAVMHQKVGGEDSRFTGGDTSRLLDTLLATGRAYLAGKHPQPLQRGDDLEAEPAWAGVDGKLKSTVALPPEMDLIPGLPCHAVDRATGHCRRLRTPLADTALLEWIARPPMAPEQTAAWLESLSRRHPGADFPAAPGLKIREVKRKPSATLRVLEADPVRQLPMLAKLEFQYGPVTVPDGAPGTRVRWIDGDDLAEAARDIDFERAGAARLRDAGLVPHTPPVDNLFGRTSEADGYGLDPSRYPHWGDFAMSRVAELRESGWDIVLPPALVLREVKEEEWYSELQTQGDGSACRYEQGIVVDGKRINLLPVFRDFLQMQARRSLEEILAGIPDAPYPLSSEAGLLLIPGERFRRMVATLFEVLGPDALDRNRRLRLSPWQAAELYTGETRGWRPPDNLLARVKSLRERRQLDPLDSTDAFEGELRPYQRDGLGWIDFLYRHGLGGILADDMGLGKTVQVIAAMLRIREVHRNSAPFLIVSPASVLPNWKRECARFAPSLRVHRHHGVDRHANREQHDLADVVLTTYGTLLRDIDDLAERSFAMVVLDEAQAVKNPRSRAGKAARRLNGDLRLALSGTPLENHLGELHSLFQFAAPGYLGGETQFNDLFRHPIERGDNPVARERLHRRVNPLLLRRRKDAVATDLPPKTEIVREIELTSEQADDYEVIRTSGQRELGETFKEKGFERSRIHALDLLLKLRQVCCDPRLRKSKTRFKPEHSAKLVWLRESLPEMIEEGRRILLFSQFTSMLDLIQPELKALDIPYVEIRGSTRDRDTPVQEFQNGKAPVFLISLKAGGTGLNLTAADTVVFYDPWWNPAAEAQAADRAHRIGQDKPVFIYKLICRGTVESRVLEFQERKKDLQSLIGDRGGSTLAFSEDDFKSLLSPLE